MTRATLTSATPTAPASALATAVAFALAAAPAAAQAPPVALPLAPLPPSVALSGPRTITDWTPGEPVPLGYHPVARPRDGLAVGGAFLFGVTYLGSLGVATSQNHGTTARALYAPIVGPFVQVSSTATFPARLVLAFDGLAQAAGVAMFIVGLTVPRRLLLRNDVVLLPMTFGAGSAGVGWTGTF
jgi:hypothetical protein